MLKKIFQCSICSFSVASPTERTESALQWANAKYCCSDHIDMDTALFSEINGPIMSKYRLPVDFFSNKL